MKASQFSDAQKALILKQGEVGTPVAEICSKVRISQATCSSWTKEYAGLLPDEMLRPKQFGSGRGLMKDQCQVSGAPVTNVSLSHPFVVEKGSHHLPQPTPNAPIQHFRP
jgi:putative transposase